jgi:hypothetical protein
MSAGKYALPANAARRLLEGGSPDDYRAGIAKLKADGLIDVRPSGTWLTFTDKGARRFA